MVNCRTYLRGLTSKGTVACTKRPSERAKAEIKGIYTETFMDRLTNLNPKIGSEIPLSYITSEYKDVRGVKHYVVCLTPSQSKQSTRSSRKNGESPKSVFCQEQAEFGISRSAKALGRRRIHSTAFTSGRESSKFSIGDIEFEGSTIKNQFNLLYSDLKLKNKASNLTTILSNKEFLIGCYSNIKSKPGNMASSLGKETLNGISPKWFEEVCNSFRNGSFRFKPSRRTYIPKSNGKLRPLTMPSPRDKIIQEGMRILLNVIFEKDFRKSSHAFQTNKGCHTALNQIRLECGKVNWFIEGGIDQQYPSIDHGILVGLLREKIQDEPFIDIIYKYLKVGYEESKDEKIIPMKIGLAQGGLISPILSNIYMHPFDVWVEDSLIPKYSIGKKKKTNPEYTKMIRDYDKSIRTTLDKDPAYGRVYYVRYVDDFIIGIIGSKGTCEIIKTEIKSFLSERLQLSLNIDKTKITHSTKDKALFLGYHICCTPIEKMRIGYKVKGKLVRNTTQTILLAPVSIVLERLKEKGFLNSKNMPTRNGRYINIDLWNIVENHLAIQRGILNYYAMANNYGRLAARVHYILKYSCALTISSKMKLRTMRGAFKKYGKELTIQRDKKSISFPKISYTRPKSPRFMKEVSFDRLLDRLIFRFRKHAGIIKSPCILCGCESNIEMHHIMKLKDVIHKKDWLSQTMAKYLRKQVPVCKPCHLKIHADKYDGPKL
jgi:group II intron reverse transcriptase/maturase